MLLFSRSIFVFSFLAAISACGGESSSTAETADTDEHRQDSGSVETDADVNPDELDTSNTTTNDTGSIITDSGSTTTDTGSTTTDTDTGSTTTDTDTGSITDTNPPEDTNPEPRVLEYICSSEVSEETPFPGYPGKRFRANFTIPEGAYSFQLVSPFHPGKTNVFENMETPDGYALSFIDQAYQSFHRIIETTSAEVDTLLIPPVPSYSGYVSAGTYSLEGFSTEEEFCFRVIVNEDPGNVIEVNFYMVEGSGLTAASAPTDPDWIAALASLQATYASVNIEVNTNNANYFDITGADATEHRIIDSENEVGELVALSLEPQYDPLRLNVFLVEGFGGELDGLIGYSSGIPGAAGLHGSPASGVTFGSDGMLGDMMNGPDGELDGNVMLGRTMAHEIAHYLGIFHTTERQNNITDQIDDTPSCSQNVISNYEQMSQCPDFHNLMFPTMGGSGVGIITDGQLSVLRGQPNVQP